MLTKSVFVFTAFVAITAGVSGAEAHTLTAATAASAVATAPIATTSTASSSTSDLLGLPIGTVIFHTASGSGCDLNGVHYNDGDRYQVLETLPNGKSIWINVECVSGVGWVKVQ